MKTGRKLLSSLLALLMLITMLPAYSYAAPGAIALADAEIDAGVLEGSFFYIGTEASHLQENVGAPYLVKIGRGGDASEKASIEIKLVDITTKYGVDYKVNIHNNPPVRQQGQCF